MEEFIVVEPDDDESSSSSFEENNNYNSNSNMNRLLLDKLKETQQSDLNTEFLELSMRSDDHNSLGNRKRNVHNNRKKENDSNTGNNNVGIVSGDDSIRADDEGSNNSNNNVHFRRRNYKVDLETGDQLTNIINHHNGHEVEVESTRAMTRRCACNLSQCASTNYMCKSERRIDLNPDGSTSESDAGCFVEEFDPSTVENINNQIHQNGATTTGGGGGIVGLTEANGKITSARRGCIEMLSRDKFKLCNDQTGAPVHCCFGEDMCNYPKTFYPPQIRSPSIQHSNRISFDSNSGALSSNLDQQVWLRAALLTIPIFGIIILIILIIFARRMLKNDSKDKENRISRMNSNNRRRNQQQEQHHEHHLNNKLICNNRNTYNNTSSSSSNSNNISPNSSPNNFQTTNTSCPLIKPIIIEDPRQAGTEDYLVQLENENEIN